MIFFVSCVCAGGSGRKVISADKHIVKVWDSGTGDIFTNLQPQEPGINDVLHWKDSGLIMLGMDAPRIQVHLQLPSILLKRDRCCTPYAWRGFFDWFTL